MEVKEAPPVEAPPDPELEMELKVPETESRLSLPAELIAELGSVIEQKPAEDAWVPLPDMYKDMINLIPMNVEEEQVLKKVLKKDDDYKKTVEERLSVLRKEIKTLRARWEAALVENEKKTKKKKRVVDKMCARCLQPQGILGTIKWWFVSKPRCQRCHFYVCKLCRHKQVNGQWLCALCVRYREMQQLTGEWFARCRGIGGSDLVKASLRIIEQNPQWREKPVYVEVAQAPAEPAPPDEPKRKSSGKKRKHAKRRISRKSTTRLRKKSASGSKGGRRSTMSNRGSASKGGRRSTIKGGKRSTIKGDRGSTSAADLAKRKSSMKAGKRVSMAPTEPAQSEETSEPPAETTEAEEGQTNESEKKDAKTSISVPKGAGKKGGAKKRKGKKAGGKGKKKGKGKGNVNVSFATEGKGVWNNSYEGYEDINSGVTESSEDSRKDTDTVDSVSEFTENSDDSMPIGTSAAGEERKRRRKMAGKIATDSLEKIMAPTSVYFSQSKKQSKYNQNADMRQRGVLTKSPSDVKRWVAYVNMKRHSFCKHNAAQPCEKQISDVSHGSSFQQLRGREHSTTAEPKLPTNKDSYRSLQRSSASHEPILVSVHGQVESSTSDKFDELAKPISQHFTAPSSVRVDRHKKQTISTETYQISTDEHLRLEARSEILKHSAALAGSPIKEHMRPLDISKHENGVQKYNRQHAKNVESRWANKHAEAGEFRDMEVSVEKVNMWAQYPSFSPVAKAISPTSKSHISSKHRPGKILSRPASNMEIQPAVDSRREECSKAPGSIFFQNLSKSAALRRLRCPVSYMFEYNESATALGKPCDSQSKQDLNLNFPDKSNSKKKKKGRKKSEGKKGKRKSGKGKRKSKKKSVKGDKKKKSTTEAEKGSEAMDVERASTSSKLPSGKREKKSKVLSLNEPKLQPSGLGLDLLMLGSSNTNIAVPPPPRTSLPRQPAPAKMECAQVQTEFKRRGTRCVVCPFCRLFCEYGRENFKY